MDEQRKKAFIKKLKEEYQKKAIVINIKRSSFNRVELICDRGGQYSKKNDAPRKRQTTTKKANCPFSLVVTLKKGEWGLRKSVNDHNHPINDSTGTGMIGHSGSRRPNKVEQERIANLGSKGVKPAQIMSILKDEGANENISLADINNHLYKSRQELPSPT
jgi:hypothetical protein